MKYTLKAHERLKSRKSIQELFQTGKSVKSFPFKLVYTPLETSSSEVQIQFTASVSKRLFKSAVDRNRIKRLVREAYRLEKPDLLSSLGASYAIMIIYISKKPLTFELSQSAMSKITKELKKRTSNHQDPIEHG
jgi:ribonuclease P protein component